MKVVRIATSIVAFGAVLLWSAIASAQPRAIDTAKSKITIHVGKAGVFSGFGHIHEVEAPIESGTVDVNARRVELRVGAANLRVLPRNESEKDLAEIQKTMVGPEVLDAQHYPEIAFKSTAVELAGTGAWKVQGDLTLHGQTQSVTVSVSEKQGVYTGSAEVKQTEFGIKPVRAGGGTVRVKDELRIDFEIQLAR